jgi:hypothetical protein
MVTELCSSRSDMIVAWTRLERQSLVRVPGLAKRRTVVLPRADAQTPLVVVLQATSRAADGPVT